MSNSTVFSLTTGYPINYTHLKPYLIMNTKTLIGIIILLAVIFGVYKLTSNPEVTSTGSKKHTVSIGMVTFPGYGPLYLAKEKKFFGDFDVNLTTIESIGDLRAGFNSGKLDMYISTHDAFQSIKGSKPQGQAILVLDESHGADGILVDASINSVKNFKGKNIAIEKGLPPSLVLQYMLNKEGMTLKDIKYQDLPTTDIGSAFVAKKVDIAGLYEPSLSESNKARANSKVLVTSADTPGLVQDILIAHKETIANSPEILAQITEGYFKAVEYIKANPDDSYAIMSKAFNLTPADMKDFASLIKWPTKTENLSMFDDSSEVNVFKTFSIVGDILEKNNELDIRVKPHDIFTNKIINYTQ